MRKILAPLTLILLSASIAQAIPASVSLIATAVPNAVTSGSSFTINYSLSIIGEIDVFRVYVSVNGIGDGSQNNNFEILANSSDYIIQSQQTGTLETAKLLTVRGSSGYFSDGDIIASQLVSGNLPTDVYEILITGNWSDGEFVHNFSSITPASFEVIPEPATYAAGLSMIILTGALLMRRRRNRTQA